MLNRLKKALVESYVGAVALGYLLADIVLQFVGIFVSPVSTWASRKNLKEVMPNASAAADFTFRDGLPYVVRFVGLLVVWWILVRWLYFKPSEPEKQTGEPAP